MNGSYLNSHWIGDMIDTTCYDLMQNKLHVFGGITFDLCLCMSDRQHTQSWQCFSELLCIRSRVFVWNYLNGFALGSSGLLKLISRVQHWC